VSGRPRQRLSGNAIVSRRSIAAIQSAAYRTTTGFYLPGAVKTIVMDALAQNAAIDGQAQSAGLV
jgi:hypothetical protein